MTAMDVIFSVISVIMQTHNVPHYTHIHLIPKQDDTGRCQLVPMSAIEKQKTIWWTGKSVEETYHIIYCTQVTTDHVELVAKEQKKTILNI